MTTTPASRPSTPTRTSCARPAARPVSASCRVLRRDSHAPQPRLALPTVDAMAVDASLDALPGLLHDLRPESSERRPRRSGLLRRAPRRVRAPRAGRPRRRAAAARPGRCRRRRRPARSRASRASASLSCPNRLCAPRRASRSLPPPLTITPGSRRAGDTGDDRHRRGEDQRTRRRDDEDGERADRVAAERPGEPGDDERDREEQGGVAVGHPNERRPLRLALPARAARRRRRRSRQRAGWPGARRPPRRLPFRCGPSRLRCARRAAARPSAPTRREAPRRWRQPVHRDHLAVPHEHEVAGARASSTGTSSTVLAGRAVRDAGARARRSAVSSRRARPAADSSSAFPPASMRPTTAPARYSPRRERTGHGDERDRVDADVAAQQRSARPTRSAARA